MELCNVSKIIQPKKVLLFLLLSKFCFTKKSHFSFQMSLNSVEMVWKTVMFLQISVGQFHFTFGILYPYLMPNLAVCLRKNLQPC